MMWRVNHDQGQFFYEVRPAYGDFSESGPVPGKVLKSSAIRAVQRARATLLPPDLRAPPLACSG